MSPTSLGPSLEPAAVGRVSPNPVDDGPGLTVHWRLRPRAPHGVARVGASCSYRRRKSQVGDSIKNMHHFHARLNRRRRRVGTHRVDQEPAAGRGRLSARAGRCQQRLHRQSFRAGRAERRGAITPGLVMHRIQRCTAVCWNSSLASTPDLRIVSALRKHLKFWLFNRVPGFAGRIPYFGATVHFPPGAVALGRSAIRASSSPRLSRGSCGSRGRTRPCWTLARTSG